MVQRRRENDQVPLALVLFEEGVDLGEMRDGRAVTGAGGFLVQTEHLRRDGDGCRRDPEVVEDERRVPDPPHASSARGDGGSLATASSSAARRRCVRWRWRTHSSVALYVRAATA